VRQYQKTQEITLKSIGEGPISIHTSDVAFIEAIKGTGNFKIYLFSRKPFVIANKTFDFLKSVGFHEETFYKLGKSLLYNIVTTEFHSGYLRTNCKNDLGIRESFEREVPKDDTKKVRQLFLK
jgi:hypothetical protein